MAASAIDLCSRALVGLGADPIQSFDEDTAEAEAADSLYPGVRDAVLSLHAWGFATGQSVLQRETAVPLADFAFAYSLPKDFLRAVSAGTKAGRGLIYRIHEERLHTDAKSVVLTFVFRADESAWPPWFDDLTVKYMRAELAVPLTESTSRAEAFAREAVRGLSLAKLLDAQQDTPSGFADFSLIDVRD